MYVKSVEEKLASALEVNPAISHADFVQQLDYQEQRGLLDTVRDMERRGKLKRDISEKVDGKAVLKYVIVHSDSAASAPATPSESVSNAPST